MYLRIVFTTVALVLALSCGIPDEGPSMRPGEDCLACHDGNIATRWTVAGTVVSDPNAPVDAAIEDAKVIITDVNGRTFTLNTNSAGNFYTGELLDFPLTVEIQRGTYLMKMQETPAVGSCNSCHTLPAQNGAPGRLFVPYQKLERSPALLRTSLQK